MCVGRARKADCCLAATRWAAAGSHTLGCCCHACWPAGGHRGSCQEAEGAGGGAAARRHPERACSQGGSAAHPKRVERDHRWRRYHSRQRQGGEWFVLRHQGRGIPARLVWAEPPPSPLTPTQLPCPQVANPSDLANVLDQCAVGDRVEVTVQRSTDQVRASESAGMALHILSRIAAKMQ